MSFMGFFSLSLTDYFLGRTNNLWVSPPGCLMFSFTIEMENGRVVPLLQYVISLAITEAIIDICQSKVSYPVHRFFLILVDFF